MNVFKHAFLVVLAILLAACGNVKNHARGPDAFSEAQHEPKMIGFVPILGTDRPSGRKNQGLGKEEWVKVTTENGELFRLWGNEEDFYFNTSPNGQGVPYSAELLPEGGADFYFRLNPNHSKKVIIISYCTYTPRTAAECGMMEDESGARYVAAR